MTVSFGHQYTKIYTTVELTLDVDCTELCHDLFAGKQFYELANKKKLQTIPCISSKLQFERYLCEKEGTFFLCPVNQDSYTGVRKYVTCTAIISWE